jgi:polyferredoxin
MFLLIYPRGYQGGHILKTAKQIIHQWSWALLIFYLVVGWFYPILGIAALVCMLAPVITAFFKGRMWCGSFCPRGSFNDMILSRLSRKLRLPAFLKATWFRFVFLVLLLSFFGVQIFVAWGDITTVGYVFLRMVFLTTLLAIILGVSYNQRTWCGICPMGTLAHYASKVKGRI